MNELVFRNANGVPMTNSLLVAETFGKQHLHVVRDIENLLDKLQDIENQCNPKLDAHKTMFLEQMSDIAMPNGGTRTSKYYVMNREGFTLLAMGYTGKKALEFKLRYIAAFNLMEQQLNQGFQIQSDFMQTQMQMMNQMMQLCNSMMQRIERLEGVKQVPPPSSVPQPVIDLDTSDKEYPWDGVITTYRKLRTFYPKYVTVVQAAEELRRRDIGIRQRSLYRYLRENGLISSRESTYQRPSAECVKNGWMVCIYGRTMSIYPGRRYHTPYLSPEFVDILERQFSARRTQVMNLWKEEQL